MIKIKFHILDGMLKNLSSNIDNDNRLRKRNLIHMFSPSFIQDGTKRVLRRGGLVVKLFFFRKLLQSHLSLSFLVREKKEGSPFLKENVSPFPSTKISINPRARKKHSFSLKRLLTQILVPFEADLWPVECKNQG